MKFTSAVTVALAAVAEFANAAPAPGINDGTVIVTGIHDKRQARPNPVTGIFKGVTGDYRPYRQDLRNFSSDQGGRLLNLFLLALDRMYGWNRGNPNSYWDLAGIHGRPYQGWNNEPLGDGSPNSGNPNSGYCTHGSTLFPPWHRPYLTYFEQTLFKNAEQLIATIPSSASSTFKQQWNDALNGLRLPYWDWASSAEMPPVLTSPRWTVTRPNGQRQEIENPLFAAKLKSGTYNDRNLFPSFPFYQWSRTLRYPTSTNGDASSQNGLVQNQLRANAQNLRDRVYRLLVDGRYNTWSAFASKTNNNGDSLEAIHDVIHGLTGNDGHMSWVDYSSFDPIFWLHHANVDRIFAIHQALRPSAWVTSAVNNGGTYGVRPGTREDRNTRLTPFRQSNGQWHTSDTVRDTSSFGYGYKETPKWRFKNKPQDYAAWVRTQVNNLYGNTNRALQSAATRRRKREVIDPTNSTEVALDESVQDHKYWDWQVNIKADKTALNGSYFVHIFVGKPSEDPALWSSSKDLAGDFVVFTHRSGIVAPGIDASKVDPYVTGSVPLTNILIEKFADPKLNSLNREDVIPYLKENLNVRVSKMDDSKVGVNSVPGLDVVVQASEVTLPYDDKGGSVFPTYGEPQFITEIVANVAKAVGF